MIKSIILLFISLLLSQQLKPSDFEVTHLPGLAHQPSFKHYSGFIESTPGNYIFFWFVESQNDPSNDPLIYWTNGGPGASGINYGFFVEHGPFRLQPNNKTVYDYDQSWNKIANVLYVEQPAGTGFSYSEDTSHYNTGDTQSANDMFYFFINFYDIFTEFQGNDFYLTSESYGGTYIPTTAKRILDGKTEKGGDALFKRMKGFLIGNPSTVYYGKGYYDGDQLQMFAEYFFHGLIPIHEWNKISQACDFDDYYTVCDKDFSHPSRKCQQAYDNAQKYIPDPTDQQDVLAPVCLANNQTYGLTWNKAFDPCLLNYGPEWIQQADVHKALHVGQHNNPNWPEPRDGFNYEAWGVDVSTYYPIFFKEVPHWNIEIVSGTSDPNCPFTGTLRWTNCLDRKITTDAYDWTIDGQPAGKTIEYDGFTLTTVKGCGHAIPWYCPVPGIEFIKNFLSRTKQ